MMRKTSSLILFFFLISCTQKKQNDSKVEVQPLVGTFGYDINFIRKFKNAIVLGTQNSKSKVLVVADYQARVMTSTSGGDAGKSYGWINYKLIESGKIPSHIFPVGGEDRFWLGPEGGQYSIFFKKGDPFDFDHWQTPSLIDTESFDLISSDSLQATFQKKASITNYSGFTFDLGIQRKIQLLDSTSIAKEFGISSPTNFVAYQTENSIRNSGTKDWKKETGLLSIWILGMFNPSDHAMIILPHDQETKDSKVTTDYFGSIPAERLKQEKEFIVMKADGKYRGKLGVAPGIAKNVAGSYDADHHILTIVKFDLDKTADYVNSKWEKQQHPYKGDAVNAYNDGPLKEGGQLGPFYELESSSPARELKVGESITHRSITIHFEGDESKLDELAKSLLGISLTDIH
jgi:hypothetical protein